MTPEKKLRCQEVIEEIQGTCCDLHNVLKEHEKDDAEILNEIDQEIFCCEGCGWWCEISEMSDKDQYCTDCEDEEDD